MPIQFLDLPSEILILILHSLDLSTLVACIATNRRVKSIIDGSTLLEYRLAAHAACVEDNPFGNTNVTSADRIIALQKRQTAFSELLPTSTRTVLVDNFPNIVTDSTFYALSGGIFAFAESSKRALRWISVTSIGHLAPPVWERLELDEYILAAGLAVPEEDLLVVLSSTALLDLTHPLPSDAVLKLQFYETSTRSAHREAQEPVIILSAAVEGFPDFELDICGPKVSILIQCPRSDSNQDNRVLIYDWKKGQLQMDLVYNSSSSAALLLSTDTILLAVNSGALELWTIPDVPEHISGPAISLKLPQLPNNSEYFIERTESNPKGYHTPASQLSFHSSFIDSLVVLEVTHYATDSDLFFGDLLLIIPRRALLQQIPSVENRGQERLWADWGPHISRSLDAQAFVGRWPTIICGQRCVFRTTDQAILLLDFNPYTVKKTLLEQAKVKDRGEAPATDRFILVPSSELDFVDELALFGEQAHSRIGYVAKKFPEATTWTGVMMDEEWIVGVDVRPHSSMITN